MHGGLHPPECAEGHRAWHPLHPGRRGTRMGRHRAVLRALRQQSGGGKGRGGALGCGGTVQRLRQFQLQRSTHPPGGLGARPEAVDDVCGVRYRLPGGPYSQGHHPEGAGGLQQAGAKHKTWRDRQPSPPRASLHPRARRGAHPQACTVRALAQSHLVQDQPRCVDDVNLLKPICKASAQVKKEVETLFFIFLKYISNTDLRIQIMNTNYIPNVHPIYLV
mmetsp:Transcript_715/g.1540  ORF Transcript_715/g.1540 Transcript_715/m.1540 type:complete len:220 (+) Transcript_715:699-1358(+)